MSATGCTAKTSKGGCKCQGWAKAAQSQGFYTVCATDGCSHTSDVHGGHADRKGAKPASAPVKAQQPDTEPEAPSEPAKAAESHTAALDSSGAPTPAQMRAWLRSQNVEGVGMRGRLKPEHIALALSKM